MGKGLEVSIILELLLYVSASLIPLALPLAILDALKTAQEMLNTHNIVIVDRGLASYNAYATVIYSLPIHDFTRMDMLSLMERVIKDTVNTKLVEVYIESSIDTCMSRINLRGSKEYFDKEPLEKFEIVKNAFDYWFKHPHPLKDKIILPNEGTLQDLSDNINNTIYKILRD